MILTRYKHFMLGLLSVAALASCAVKEELVPEKQQYPSFYGTMEAAVNNETTKAYANDKFYGFWNKNDELSIFYGGADNKKYIYVGSSGTTSGRFDPAPGTGGSSPDATATGKPNYAVYPYDDQNAFQEEDGMLIVPFPKERTINTLPEGIGASIMLVAKSETTQLPFQHVAGYLGFQLYGEDVSVASITMTSGNGEPFSGSANVVFDAEDNLQVSFVGQDDDDASTCTFVYEPPIPLNASSESPKTFWITLPPTVLEAGLTLTVKDASGRKWNKESTLKEVKVNQFRRFTPMEVILEDDVDPNLAEYAKASSITGEGSYLIVNVADNLVFTGNIDGSSKSISPVDGIITDPDGTLSAYEFIVEQNGTNYYLKFNDGNYLVSDYSSPGNGTTGLRYVSSRSAVTFPYALTTANGAFMFSTTQMTSTSSTNQVLYYKTQDNANIFKIGGSGTSIGVHLYKKGGKLDRGLKFEPEEVVCLQGSTPEKPELSGTYTTLAWTSDNTAVATVDGSGNVTIAAAGTAVITATAAEDARYQAGSASYTLTVLDASTAVYAKASAITVGGTYLVVDVADRLVFTGAQTNNGQSVSPENDIIIDRNRTLSAYEFTVERSGNNYYLKFSDGKYLICDYTGSGGNSTSGIRYVNSQGEVNYPYALTVTNGAFFFKTSRADNGDANQYLYFKTSDNVFKIGGSGSSIGVHLYMKGGKRDRGLQFASESVTCFLGSTPEKPELSGAYSTLSWNSGDTAVATVDNNGNVTAKGVGTTTITASAAEDDDYIAGSASYTLTVLDPNSSSYTKVTTLTVGGTYLIVNVADNLVFKGATDGSAQSVSPTNGVIMDTNQTLSAYEFTVEQNGTNYYLKFNDGNYLVSDYSSPGNGTTGLRYVSSRSAVTFPYALTTANGAFMFSTTQMTSTSSTNQVLYYKTQDNANIFKIGGSGTSIGVHLYLKGGGGSGGDTPPAPEDWQDKGTFNLENLAVKDYLTAAANSYDDTNDGSVTIVSQYVNGSSYSSITRKDCPAPVSLTWTNPASSSTVVTIYSDETLSQKVWSQNATTNATSAEIYNLTPGLKYYYTVSVAGSIREKGYFNTTGRRRMMRVSSSSSSERASNCRDLGGMITKDGKRIRYGFIFRGSNMDNTTPAEKDILVNFMKIKLDIDLRNTSDSGSQRASREFTAADYPEVGYLNKGFSGFNDLASDAGLARVGDVINAIMDTVLEGNAVYFHCWVGADRTGIIAVMLEGLLGISEEDCSIDYELTSFSSAGMRPRDGSLNDHYFTKGLALLRSQTGTTFQDKCNSFLTSSKVGVSQEKINRFKSFILE